MRYASLYSVQVWWFAVDRKSLKYVVQRWKEECGKCLTVHLFQPFLWGKILLCISNLICRAPAPASSRDDTHISRKNTLCFAKFPVSQMQNYETKTYFFSFVKQLHYVFRNFVFFQFRKTIWNMFLVFSYFFFLHETIETWRAVTCLVQFCVSRNKKNRNLSTLGSSSADI